MEEKTKSVMNENLRDQAVKDVLNEKSNAAADPVNFMKDVHAKFIQRQLDNFPHLCEVTRWQNKMKWDELNAIGNKGKYTDSLGWSEQRDFKFEYEIPNELYSFMQNLVYKDFWGDDNARTWRRFMKKICDGGDAMETLIWVKKIYGDNQQEGIVKNG